ncbi:MAG TPA: GNAT family N-acetyltransferase [Chitinophagales bacterium]|nr:GNAT family N-acetyltransferase [Chitinophagales bacterium]
MKNISFYPLTKNRWKDFEILFGDKGACGGCWCMHWRIKKSDFEKTKGDGNKKKMKQLVDKDDVPGLLMYADKKVVGWCSVGPREKFLVLENSRVLKRVDDKPVWSIVCFFIEKNYRRLGLSQPFLKYAIDYCRKKGAKIIEAYPLDVKAKDYPAVFAFTGFYPTFVKAGFVETERRSDTRPIMRKIL